MSDVKITSITIKDRKFEDQPNVFLAEFSASIGPCNVRGFRLIEKKGAPFVLMPKFKHHPAVDARVLTLEVSAYDQVLRAATAAYVMMGGASLSTAKFMKA